MNGYFQFEVDFPARDSYALPSLPGPTAFPSLPRHHPLHPQLGH